MQKRIGTEYKKPQLIKKTPHIRLRGGWGSGADSGCGMCKVFKNA